MENRSARELSALLRAAGAIEEARAILAENCPEHRAYLEGLKRVADELAADAVAGRVKIANDFAQNYGRSGA